MILFWKHHRNTSRLVHMAGPEAPAEVVSEKTPEATDVEAKLKAFVDKHHPDTFRAQIEEDLNKTDMSTEAKTRILNQTLAKYQERYNAARAEIARLKENHEKNIGEIQQRHQAARDALRAKVGKLDQTIGSHEAVKPKLENVENKDETLKAFDRYREALNNQYFNRALQKERLGSDQFDEYDDWADELEDNVEDQINYRLEASFQEKDPKKREQILTEIQKDLKALYDKWANGDGFIDYSDLRTLKGQAERFEKQYKELSELANNPSQWGRLESVAAMNESVYDKAAEAIAEQIVKNTKLNHSETQFIAGVKAIAPTAKINDFDEAVDVFEDTIDSKKEQGPKVLLETLQAFNKDASQGREKLDNYTKAISHAKKTEKTTFEPKIDHEKDLLLKERTWSKNLDDDTVIGFLRQGPQNRLQTLQDTANRQKLFQAIQNIQARPNQKENKGYLSDARFWALVKAAEEAEWVVKNMGQENALKQVEASKSAPAVNLKFGDITERHSTRYVSRVARGGFNGKDLAMNLGRIWAVTTIILNVRNAHKQGKMSAVLENPYLWAAAGTWYGIGKVKELPESAKYFSENAGGKNRIATKLRLNSLSRKLDDRTKVEAFVNNEEEFKIMQKIMETDNGPKKVKDLLKKVRKNKTRSIEPGLTQDDLEEAFGKSFVASVPKDQSRVRFLFYEKFMTSRRSISELKQHSHEWIDTVTPN